MTRIVNEYRQAVAEQNAVLFAVYQSLSDKQLKERIRIAHDMYVAKTGMIDGLVQSMKSELIAFIEDDETIH